MKQILITIFFHIFCFNSFSFAADLNIAVASNFTPTLKIIAQDYEKQKNIKINLTSASSGKLTSQIMFGAPFDIFFSASPKFIDALAEQHLIIEDSRYDYAVGEIVLWPANFPTAEQSLVIANPKTAPYGIAAQQFLDQFPHKGKLIKADNIAHAFQMRYNNNVDVGILALAQMKQKQIKDYAIISQKHYDPIIQQLAIVKTSNNLDQAQTFVEHLKSDEIKKLIEKDGYLTD